VKSEWNSPYVWWVVPAMAVAMIVVSMLGAGGGVPGLRHWAKINGLTLTFVERRRWEKGKLHAGKNGQVFFFTAKNEHGQCRDGFARVIPPLLCLFSEPVKIKWESKDWK
jgi:hypothetical protein